VLAYCPVCEKLCTATPAPRDALGRPGVRVVSHSTPVGGGVEIRRVCPGSGRRV
jgi:hypothetical protein